MVSPLHKQKAKLYNFYGQAILRPTVLGQNAPGRHHPQT